MQANFTNVQVVHGKRTMISIFPLERRLWRDYGPTINGGRTEYILSPPANKGEYSKLDVYDGFQRVMDPMKSEPGRPGFGPWPVSAIEICNDAMHNWVECVQGTKGDFRPGIMIIAGDTPTPEELASLEANQQRYFERLVQEAQGHAERNEWKMITDVHRAAARYTGYRPAAGDSNWVAEMGTSRTKECTSCFSPIDARSKVCRICRAPQDEPTAPPAPEKPKAQRIPPPPARAQVAA